MTDNLPQVKESKNIEDLLKKIQPAIDKKDFNVLTNYFGRQVIQLGTDEAFALRDNEGEIRAFKQRLTLSNKDGTLIQPVPGGPFVISAQGYQVWAEAAGATVVFPKEVLVNNSWLQNPFCETDDQGRKTFYARAVAFRFSSKGIPQVSDRSTVFDMPTYRMIDLIAKAKKYPQAFMLLPKDQVPDEDGIWSEYHFDEATNLFVNVKHEEALGWYSQIMQRQKKGLDFAQTFAQRNALKHLSGLQKAPGPEWTIAVLSWRPTSSNIIKWDQTVYSQLQHKVGNLITSNGEDFTPGHALQIEKDVGKEYVDEQEAGSEIETEDQETATEPIDVEHAEVTEDFKELSKEDQAVLQNLKVVEKEWEAEFVEACKAEGADPKGKIDPSMAVKILKKVREFLDYQAE